MKTSKIFLFILLTVQLATAQDNDKNNRTQTIRGTVTDAVSKMPLIGATVIVQESDPAITTTTDFDGNFTLENVLAGEHTISFSLITYNNKEVTFNPSKENNLEIELETK